MSYADPLGYEKFMGRWSTRLAPLFLRFAGVEDGQRILDVGCGTGVLTRAALAMGENIRVTGVDPVETFMPFARNSAGPRATFQVGSVDALPFADCAFDAALGLLVLQEFDDPDRAIAEMARVTRPFGKVVACQWDFRDGMPMMSIFWDLACELLPDFVTGYQARSGPTRNEDVMALARRWSAAGLSNVRATSLDFIMPFGSFEEFWIPFTSGATPLSAFSAAVNRVTNGELETRYRKRLRNVRADGSFEFAARALAISGIAAR